MLRAMDQASAGPWPFASADSTNPRATTLRPPTLSAWPLGSTPRNPPPFKASRHEQMEMLDVA